MRRRATATIMAAALVLTQGAATPSRAADIEDVLGVLLGIGAVYAIGRAIEQSRAEANPPVTRQVVPERIRPPAVTRSLRPEPRRDDRWGDRDRWRDGDRWSGRGRELPAECLYRFDTQSGPLVGFGKQCLENTMRRTGWLPDDCAIRTRIGGRDRTIYSARCLRLEGWQVAGAPADTWRPGGRIGN